MMSFLFFIPTDQRLLSLVFRRLRDELAVAKASNGKEKINVVIDGNSLTRALLPENELVFADLCGCFLLRQH